MGQRTPEGNQRDTDRITFRAAAVAVVLVLHIVGLIGFITPSLRQLFLSLTPVNLLITALFVTLSAHDVIKPQKTYLAALIIFAGIAVEWAGVHTGVLFGDYSYGSTFGFQLDEIPLLIGVNWLILVLCCSSMANRLNASNPVLAIFAAALMVIIDIPLEQVAPLLDFWEFKGGEVPFFNYLSWFAVAWVLSWLVLSVKLLPSRRLATTVFIAQFLFFTILSFVL